MKVAHIVPIPNLPQIKGSPLHMCLAPIAKHDQEYFQFYKSEAENGSYVILDNGMFEGEMLSTDEILDIYFKIGASEVIAPDILGSCDKTIREVEEFSQKISENVKVMGVPHGSDLSSLSRCFSSLFRNRKRFCISTIGVSYLAFEAANAVPRSFYLANILVSIRDTEYPECHLLGVSKKRDGIRELLVLKRFSNIRSVDTSIAACAAMAGFSIRKTPDPSLFKRPRDFFYKKADPELLQENMEELECLVK